MYAIVKRNHYYGPRTERWTLDLLDCNRVETYETIEQAREAYDGPRHLGHNVSNVDIEARRVRDGVSARDLYDAWAGTLPLRDVVSSHGHRL